MNELMLAWAGPWKIKEFFYVIHNQIIACVQWYRVNIWKIYSIKRKVFFRTDFAACRISCRNADPELYIPFSWKQQAFSAASVPFGNLWENRSRRNRLSFADSLDARWDFFLSLICGFTVFGVPMAIMAMLFTGIGLGIVFSVSILQFGLTGGAVAVALLFPHYLIYLPLWDSVYPRWSTGNLWESGAIMEFFHESKRLSPESALIYNFIRCGNSFGMACKSMDFKQNSGFFEIF